MSISRQRATELADMLPDELSCDNARERLLCLLELLRSLTDEENVLSNSDIRAILSARFGEACSPSENTIGADIRAIRDSGCLGISVHITPSGTWCESSSLGYEEVRMLVNAVQASRFLTASQSAELQEALYGLLSRHQEGVLEGQVLVDQRVRKSYQVVFDTCDIISRAIRMGRKVEFTYTYNDFEGKPVFLEGDSGEKVRVETPIALIFSEGNYYFESYAPTPWRHGSRVTRSRVDRMYGARVSSEAADDDEDVRDAKRVTKERLCEAFDMVDGVSRLIFLRVRADYTNVMLDRFGYQLRYAQLRGTPGDVSSTALTCVRVAQSFAFFRWLSSAGDGIVIECPPDALTLSTLPWRRQLDGVSRESLVRDYRSVVSGYMAYLDCARDPYRGLSFLQS